MLCSVCRIFHYDSHIRRYTWLFQASNRSRRFNKEEIFDDFFIIRIVVADSERTCGRRSFHDFLYAMFGIFAKQSIVHAPRHNFGHGHSYKKQRQLSACKETQYRISLPAFYNFFGNATSSQKFIAQQQFLFHGLTLVAVHIV